jgi:hypothetical protein
MAYSQSNYHKKKKHLISQNTKAVLTLTAFAVCTAGLNMADYYHEKREALEEQNSKSQIEIIEVMQEEILRNNAISYNATDFINDIATLDYEDKKNLTNNLEGKYIEMTGTVMSIKTDNLLYEDHFTLGNTNPDSLVSHYGLINCDVEDIEQKDKLKEVESGDIITVTGKFCSENPFINISDCVIVDIEKGNGEYGIDLSGIYNR